MPDISMCNGGACKRKSECFRFMATPTPGMQAYFTTPPVKADGECDYFWPLTLLNPKRPAVLR